VANVSYNGASTTFGFLANSDATNNPPATLAVTTR